MFDQDPKPEVKKTRTPFPNVKKARAALREQAFEILEAYMTTIKEARADGKYEAALEHIQWLIEHMPEEDGERLIDSSAAKPKVVEGGVGGPSIQIGVAIGGIPTRKGLPQVVDITPINEPK